MTIDDSWPAPQNGGVDKPRIVQVGVSADNLVCR